MFLIYDSHIVLEIMAFLWGKIGLPLAADINANTFFVRDGMLCLPPLLPAQTLGSFV